MKPVASDLRAFFEKSEVRGLVTYGRFVYLSTHGRGDTDPAAEKTGTAAMTKKHFITLAKNLLACRPDNARSTEAGKAWIAACNGIADTCAASNGNFDRARFLAACGV